MRKLKFISSLLILYLSILCFLKLCNIPLVVSIVNILWLIGSSFIVTLILYPFIVKIPLHVKWNTKVFLVYGGLFILVVGFILMLVPLLFQQCRDVYMLYPDLFQKYANLFSTEMIEKISTNTKVQLHDLKPYVTSFIELINKCADYLFVYILSLFIALDLSFFNSIKIYVKQKLSLLFLVYERFSIMIFLYMKATIIDLFILGIGSYLIMFLFGMKGALLYAMLLAFSNLIPYIGSMVALLIIGALSILSKGIGIWPMLLCLWGYQQFEANVIQTYLFHKVMHVRSLFTFVSFYITQTLLGFWWLLLSPILAGFLEMLVQAWMETLSSKQKEKYDCDINNTCDTY